MTVLPHAKGVAMARTPKITGAFQGAMPSTTPAGWRMPMAKLPGFEAMQAQQEAFLKAMTGGLKGGWPVGSSGPAREADTDKDDEAGLDEIKRQLQDLQTKLSKMGK